MKHKVVSFGELLLRLSPPGHERLLQSARFDATFGGAEANVAVSLAHFGFESHFVTRLPAHAVGDAGVGALRAEGVSTEAIRRGGERVGIYFAEKGASQRPSVVIYDRAHSAFATLDPEVFDWDAILHGSRWLHTSGITPALGDGAERCTALALRAAHRHGVLTSFDLNFRAKLWSRERAQVVIPELLADVDLLLANEEDLQATLGVALPARAQGRLEKEGYEPAMRQVAERFQLKWVAVSLRESFSATENGWQALLYDRESDAVLESRSYRLWVVDRIGGGDAFAAGLVRCLLLGKPSEEALEFAVAAGALKHSILGDFNRVTVAEVERLANGDQSGRVQR